MQPIPVNLITGFLGVGKTTAVRHLLANHPEGEKWAVLVNEFGEVGVDGALLAQQDVVVQEVAGGCLCCVAAPAFTTGLNRLIRRHRPDRVLVEPSGLGHPAQVLQTLGGPLYADVLDVRATVCLMDARHLSSPPHVEHPTFQDQIHLADVLIANKADLYTDHDIDAFEQFAAGLSPAKCRVAVVERGTIDPDWLDIGRSSERQAAFPEAHAFLVESGATAEADATAGTRDWLMIEGRGDGYHRVGWMIHQHAACAMADLQRLLAGLDVERKKGIFFTEHGWLALNQDDWSRVDPPNDGLSRLELIDRRPLPAVAIDRQLRMLLAP